MKKILFLLLFVFISIFSIQNVLASDETFALGAKYKVVNHVISEELDYDVIYNKDIAMSYSNKLQYSYQTSGDYDGQVVNYVEVPSNGVVKVVNWTYMNPNGWSKQTIEKMAKDYEANNPGWIVIAGVNGDYFDINGLRPLRYQTTGVSVNNGEVVNSVKSVNQIGFTNDGSLNTLIGDEKFEVTSYHTLSIYDNSENIIKTFKINKLNETISEGETGIIFPYYELIKEEVEGSLVETRICNKIMAPSDSYVVASSTRCYGMTKDKVYAKGKISNTNEEFELSAGQFAIVTKDNEVKSFLDKDVMIRVQQDVIGAYENCDNMSGCRATLVKNSEAYDDDIDEDYDLTRHPRTCIGQKEDGTIMLFTIDGRQSDYGMYGMSHGEMSAMMLHYGVVEGYNMDGGGSTTLIKRNKEGEFDVMNSPSDGSPRSDSNAILVVAPAMNLQIQKATDTTVSLFYNAHAKDIDISNVSITISSDNYEETRNITDELYTWDNLPTNTTFSLTYSYDLNYKGKVISNTSKPLSFTTGTKKPEVKECYYELIDDTYILHFDIVDDFDLASMIFLQYSNDLKMIDKSKKSLVLTKNKVTKDNITLNIVYNVGATPGSAETDIYVFSELQKVKVPSVLIKSCDVVESFLEVNYDIIDEDKAISNCYFLLNDVKFDVNEIGNKYTFTNINTFLNSYEVKLVVEYVDENNNTESVEVTSIIDRNYIKPVITSFSKDGDVLSFSYEQVSNNIVSVSIVIDGVYNKLEDGVTTYSLSSLDNSTDHTITLSIKYMMKDNITEEILSNPITVNKIQKKKKCNSSCLVIISLLNIVSLSYVLLKKKSL